MVAENVPQEIFLRNSISLVKTRLLYFSVCSNLTPRNEHIRAPGVVGGAQRPRPSAQWIWGVGKLPTYPGNGKLYGARPDQVQTYSGAASEKISFFALILAPWGEGGGANNSNFTLKTRFSLISQGNPYQPEVKR